MSLRPSSRSQSVGIGAGMTTRGRLNRNTKSPVESKQPRLFEKTPRNPSIPAHRHHYFFLLRIIGLCFACFSIFTLDLGLHSSSPHHQQQQDGTVHIYTTNFGWDNPDTNIGITFGRSIRQAELWDGVKAHPAYLKDDWQSQSSKIAQVDNRYYVFLDVETCFEAQYPKYVQSIGANSDTADKRLPISSSGGLLPKLRSICPMIDSVLETRLFQKSSKANKDNNSTRLVLFECRPYGPKSCLSRRDNPHLDHRVSLISLSASKTEILPEFDLGLPPPSVTRFYLTESQESDIANGVEDYRPYLFSFVGSFRGTVRSTLKELHNGNDVLILDNLDRLENSNNLNYQNTSTMTTGDRYREILTKSIFSAIPRGDNLYSYRFTEVLSAGAIPVILSDGWVLPLCSELFDGGEWDDLAVIIPEHQARSTVDILRAISVESRCAMRRRAYRFYQTYLSSPEATIAGIIDCLERKARHKK